MSAIITITFNPALDKSISIPLLVPEKKIKCSAPVYEPGGGGINVARAIKKLGGDALAIYLASGYTGQKITSLLNDESVKSLVTETHGLTRENLIVSDRTTGKQYLFDMPGENIDQQELNSCLQQIKQLQGVKYIVASGSLPQGVPDDTFSRIALIAKQKNAKLLIDTSGEALKKAIKAGVYLIKPNLRELASLIGKEELSIEMAAGAAKQVIDHENCEVVIASLGNMGAMLVTKEFSYHIMSPAVKTRSTVGAGDSLVAGIVLSLENNKSLIEAIQYGVACGTAATMNPGTELCKKEDADNLYGKIRNEELIQASQHTALHLQRHQKNQ